MFTIEQIKAAHAKVKSGADFPAYIQDLKALGVLSYVHYVSDGHIDYKGQNAFNVSSDSKWPEKAITTPSSNEKLEHDLKIHQLGKTDYPTFCQQSADAGVEKWTVDVVAMQCTYYNKEGNEMLTEDISVLL
jgi:uncharacterized protein YbcV (DUF1398 family)